MYSVALIFLTTVTFDILKNPFSSLNYFLTVFESIKGGVLRCIALNRCTYKQDNKKKIKILS